MQVHKEVNVQIGKVDEGAKATQMVQPERLNFATCINYAEACYFSSFTFFLFFGGEGEIGWLVGTLLPVMGKSKLIHRIFISC